MARLERRQRGTIERAKRYLQRMRDVYQGIDSTSRSKEECGDDILSFFMHCYHVRDWIIHANTVGVTAKEVDEFINKNECLMICADLCNGTKHFRLARTHTGREPHISYNQYSSSTWLTGSGGFEIRKARHLILTSSGTVDALELAEKCIQCWTELLQRIAASSTSRTTVGRGLSPPSC